MLKLQTMKNVEQYLRIYNELANQSKEKWNENYPPKTWDEFYTWNTKNYKKYLKNIKDDVKRTKSYVRLSYTLNEFGFYNTFQKLDYRRLNDVLYQTSRQKLLNLGMMGSGTDHCHVFLEATNSFACNDFEIIDHFFPKALQHSKGVYYTEVSVNLLKVLYFNETDLRDEALRKADKFLSAKITLWERYVVLYFKALINLDDKEASICLLELCVAYQKMEHSVDKLYNKLAKCFGSEIHGLYRFARTVNLDFFNTIKQPKHHCFWQEFELWQKENNYPRGNCFYTYPNEMDFMNKIFEAELPTVALYNPYPNKKKLYKDADKFAIELTENAIKLYGERETNSNESLASRWLKYIRLPKFFN